MILVGNVNQKKLPITKKTGPHHKLQPGIDLVMLKFQLKTVLIIHALTYLKHWAQIDTTSSDLKAKRDTQ
jgi:hypothetical protein